MLTEGEQLVHEIEAVGIVAPYDSPAGWECRSTHSSRVATTGHLIALKNLARDDVTRPLRQTS